MLSIIAITFLSLSHAYSVPLSLQPVNNCSVNFPLHNYTIKVDDKVVRVLLSDEVTPDEDGRLRLDLNSSNLSEVTLDDSLPLMVTACNDIICRTSDPVTLSKCIVSDNRLLCIHRRDCTLSFSKCYE